jgi:hypothetical protein
VLESHIIQLASLDMLVSRDEAIFGTINLTYFIVVLSYLGYSSKNTLFVSTYGCFKSFLSCVTLLGLGDFEKSQNV